MKRSDLVFAVVAAAIAAALVFGIVGAPSFTDAYYHFNAAARMASGQGLTDAYVWTYIGAADSLPMPSHLYWMPMTSFLSGVSMILLDAPGDYRAAQVPLALCVWGAGLIGYHLGRKLGGTVRHAWIAGLLTLLSPFFVRFWGATDTFAPYAFFGAACLVMIGAAVERPRAWRWAAAGGFAALGHLTRADGLLLLGVAGLFALLCRVSLARRLTYGVWVTVGYVVVMSPFFARNLDALGAPLPLGGAQAIWFDEYNDLFNFPPDSTASTLFTDGIGRALESRRDALVTNIGTVVAVEGMVVLLPFMLYAGWRLRRDHFLHPFWLYALLMHIAMTFVFPFPGYRGGLFHSAAALIPCLSALAVVGIDAAVDAVARLRRRWRPIGAKRVFSGAALALIALLAFSYARAGRVDVVTNPPPLYAAVRDALPDGARVLFDDPPALYYFSSLGGKDGFGGATLPNGDPDMLRAVAEAYLIDYLLLKTDRAAVPAGLHSLFDAPPDFLIPIALDSEEARLYAIRADR
ncbi:MAG: glycosyltransferase family 39 protein [Chloroflexota bacterium]|nr:glycosyltransferase family 39 protein [Chloroflexota bacterium]